MTSSSGLTRLMLTNFRNYRAADLQCDIHPLILTGSNGAGKTNILEAVSFLSPGRGLRRAKLNEITYHNESHKGSHLSESGWAVAAKLSTPYGIQEIGTGLEFQDGKERRVVKIDGVFVKSQTTLSDHLHVLWLTPQMDRLFQEGATNRRRFLDRLVYGLDTHHASRVNRYEHFMRERNRVLKWEINDKNWLESLEAKMSAEGIAITVARLQFIDQLAQTKAWSLGTFPQAELLLKGQIESWLLKGSALEAEEKFKESLKTTRAQDRDSGSTFLGIHRSDFTVIYGDKNQDASFCSTGEQKALLISIIFAAARLQFFQKVGTPLILLDEVAAHLDERRRTSLFEEILALKIQAWITGTDIQLFRSFKNKIQHFEIENAMIRALSTQ